jgi:hypothetical protein
MVQLRPLTQSHHDCGWLAAQPAMYQVPRANPQVVAATTAAGVSALTLAGTPAAQYFGRMVSSGAGVAGTS